MSTGTKGKQSKAEVQVSTRRDNNNTKGTASKEGNQKKMQSPRNKTRQAMKISRSVKTPLSVTIFSFARFYRDHALKLRNTGVDSPDYALARKQLKEYIGAQEIKLELHSGVSGINTTTGGCAGIYTLDWDTLLAETALLQLFDEYSIRKILVIYESVQNVGLSGTNGLCGFFFAAIDYSDATPPSTTNGILEFDTVKAVPAHMYSKNQCVTWFVDLRPLPDWDWTDTATNKIVAYWKYFGSTSSNLTLRGIADTQALGVVRYTGLVHLRQVGL